MRPRRAYCAHLFTTMLECSTRFPTRLLDADRASHPRVRATPRRTDPLRGRALAGSARPAARRQARDRAVEVFARLRVWDTEHNNGVLIYLLLADRDVEIVADRGVHARVGSRRLGSDLPGHGGGVPARRLRGRRARRHPRGQRAPRPSLSRPWAASERAAGSACVFDRDGAWSSSLDSCNSLAALRLSCRFRRYDAGGRDGPDDGGVRGASRLSDIGLGRCRGGSRRISWRPVFYWLGRTRGRGDRTLAEAAAAAEKFNTLLDRHHIWIIIGIRFMYGLRIAGPAVIGMSHVSPLRFAVFNLIGAILWASLIGRPGYVFGQAIELMLATCRRYEGLALAASLRPWDPACMAVTSARAEEGTAVRARASDAVRARRIAVRSSMSSRRPDRGRGCARAGT